jgi:hypothetical protein
MHDPRVGRFFATDPLEKCYPYNSPYTFSENRVIDMVELEGKETGNPWLDLQLLGYWIQLKMAFQKGLKDTVEGNTNSNESINNNPCYDQETKDNLHNVQKISGSIQMTAAILDPEIQVVNSLTPVDDAITFTTGLIYDDFKVRKASKLERGFAGLEIASFVFDASVLTKPTQKIINKTAEEGIEKTTKEVVEKTVEKSSSKLTIQGENGFFKFEGISKEGEAIEFYGMAGDSYKTKNLEIEIVIPGKDGTFVDHSMKNKIGTGTFKKWYNELATWARENGYESVKVTGTRVEESSSALPTRETKVPTTKLKN